VNARTIAAALTPLRAEGSELDLDGFESYLIYLKDGGIDAILLAGTTGEGISLSVTERKTALLTALAGPLPVLAHCGAQTTADTVALAEHAAMNEADAVAVIAPPYFALDADELFAHLAAAAHACDPLPFYVYEFAARVGYAVPLEVIDRLREEVPNLAGLKVSDTPWETFEPYLIEGLDIFVGPEALIPQGFAGGAVGAVSGLASCFPDAVVALTRDPTPEAGARVGALRASLQKLPFHAAAKMVLGLRGVPVRGSVRLPLRGMYDAERDEVERIVTEWLG
jgi:dihydrodipicolinate synthase/N-acetylneuraminate lyase